MRTMGGVPMEVEFLIQIACVMFLLWGVYSHARNVCTLYRVWRKVITLLGYRTALRISGAKLRLKLQGPILQILIEVPPISQIGILALAFLFYSFWNGHSLDPWLCGAMYFVPFALFSFIIFFLPPAVIFLSASDDKALRLWRLLIYEIDSFIISFVAEAGSPEIDQVRTRNANWHEPVQRMINYLPLIVIDTRIVTSALLQELQWLIKAEDVYKTIFVTTDDGRSPLLDCWRPDWKSFSDTLICVPAREVAEVLRALTATRESLPRPGTTVDFPEGDLTAGIEAWRERDAETLQRPIYVRLHHWIYYAMAATPVGIGYLFGKIGFALGVIISFFLLWSVGKYHKKRGRSR